jgi:ABC-type nitrate/sulfonate/bicarbonate transport system permease component
MSATVRLPRYTRNTVLTEQAFVAWFSGSGLATLLTSSGRRSLCSSVAVVLGCCMAVLSSSNNATEILCHHNIYAMYILINNDKVLLNLFAFVHRSCVSQSMDG